MTNLADPPRNKTGLKYLRDRYIRRAQMINDDDLFFQVVRESLPSMRKKWVERFPEHRFREEIMPPAWEMPEYAKDLPFSVLVPPSMEAIDQQADVDSLPVAFKEWLYGLDVFCGAFWPSQWFVNPWAGIRHPMARLVSAWYLYAPGTISQRHLHQLVPEFSLRPLFFPYPLESYTDPISVRRMEAERLLLVGIVKGLLINEPIRADQLIEFARQRSDQIIAEESKEPPPPEVGSTVIPILPGISAQDVRDIATEAVESMEETHRVPQVSDLIRFMREQGMGPDHIASNLGITPSTISRIR